MILQTVVKKIVGLFFQFLNENALYPMWEHQKLCVYCTTRYSYFDLAVLGGGLSESAIQ